MYSLLTLLHSIVIYCHKFQIVYKRLKGERGTRIGVGVECYKAGITAEISRVVAAAAELLKKVGL